MICLNWYLTYSKCHVNINFYIAIILSSCRQETKNRNKYVRKTQVLINAMRSLKYNVKI